jgi:RsiW-degrading membrane proteinase PrsW (M82 family)
VVERGRSYIGGVLLRVIVTQLIGPVEGLELLLSHEGHFQGQVSLVRILTHTTSHLFFSILVYGVIIGLKKEKRRKKKKQQRK